ncbi:MAG: HlyD family secretion protein [Rhodospirillaceae bacterium]|nr:HlyD family secretion protein [Rhodospirillaceae bacterium]
MDDSRPQTEAPPAEVSPAVPRAPSKLQRVLRVLVAVVLVGAAAGGVVLYQQSARYPNTDDAYVQAHVVQIAPQISGVISKVHVVNNQHVDADAPLFDIDPASFRIAVEAAQAAFDEAAETVGASGAGVKAASAHVREAEAALANARREAVRGRALKDVGSLSASGLDTREATLKQAEAASEAAMAELDRAQQQYGGSGKDNARLRSASAALRKAQLDLSYTEVRAPSSGWVSDVSVREGAFVMMARPVFPLVEDKEWWVDAHFKETDITRIKPGQPASIEIDMYPDVMLKGEVESVSAGSGASFSLLPPENATGNWVKVTQRYTVRVKVLDRPPDPTQPLRVGASSQVKIDTKP